MLNKTLLLRYMYRNILLNSGVCIFNALEHVFENGQMHAHIKNGDGEEGSIFDMRLNNDRFCRSMAQCASSYAYTTTNGPLMSRANDLPGVNSSPLSMRAF